jgi:outer membrane protein TolC
LYLIVLAAEQRVLAAQAGVARGQTLLTVSEALVKADLRPGVDASRSRAEVARTETEVLRARRIADVARAELAALLNVDPAGLRFDAPRLTQSLPPAQPSGIATHPAVAEQQAAIEAARAGRLAAERAWYPRFHVQGASYARGTGALADGRTLGGVNGLGPNIHNWGVGFTATFPTLEFASIRARSRAEAHRERAETARLEQIKQDLGGVVGAARAELDSAFAVARQTPVQLESARAAETQASARYKAGLSPIADLADAQRLVTEAEIEDALARLTSWRALLRVAAAYGDLDVFLKEAAQ